ncbi:hypothetical protein J2T02_005417 [Chitinophaga terrae (ex Kim and Jung 2007)]|uniref:hypothetical protein n=1 Tax=Chitinophaga terrae (ex Kim and Jung 2007) TaxID=408074 RepID=UPI002780867F|nr:hypothetical protein [Chitinophaga terrae (ex Kim and Jung 2007)]MDQ0110268.1 hypothetical protein [Chitinophaga terrae (ex Kim and Jung 2007)]
MPQNKYTSLAAELNELGIDKKITALIEENDKLGETYVLAHAIKEFPNPQMGTKDTLAVDLNFYRLNTKDIFFLQSMSVYFFRHRRGANGQTIELSEDFSKQLSKLPTLDQAYDRFCKLLAGQPLTDEFIPSPQGFEDKVEKNNQRLFEKKFKRSKTMKEKGAARIKRPRK